MSLILGIETSCDETAAAVVEDGAIVRSNVVASQIARHSPYGGVVPELAAREHLKAIEPVVSAALAEAGISIKELSAVAVTNGPGLLPALLVGVNFARGLAAGQELPLIGINHFIAHIYGTFLDSGPDILGKKSCYPLLALVVSGGHTNILLINADGTAKVVGMTLDDAAGEAFDKAAKLMNLGYPGGPVIEKISAKGDPVKFAFPRSLTGEGGKAVKAENKFNFSFSGLKTALLYHCRKFDGAGELTGQVLYDTAASYQEAIIDVLTRKTFAAAEHYRAENLVLCGGVACNNPLRTRFAKLAADRKLNIHISPKKYCTDNAAMVAGLAWRSFKNRQFADYGLDAYSRLPVISNVPFRGVTTVT